MTSSEYLYKTMATSSELELFTKLNVIVEKTDWDALSKYLNPKFFGSLDSGDVVNFQILAIVAQLLTDETFDVLHETKIVLLKCVGNSCFSSYKHKKYDTDDTMPGKYCNQLYSVLANTQKIQNELRRQDSYPFSSHFPYDGIAEWSADYIASCVNAISNQLSQNQIELLRLSIQFLCNLFTFACKNEMLPECVISEKLKRAIIELINCEHESISRVSCIFVHNALNDFPKKYFTVDDIKSLYTQLMKPLKENVTCAKEAMMLLLNKENTLQDIYENLPIEDKLYLLETIYNDSFQTLYQSQETDLENALSRSMVEFLVKRFCRQSDLILKTVDTYQDGMEPAEVIILLDILGVLTSEPMENLKFLRANKSLLINCTYLLKSVHMAGKLSDNYFTPVQKLKDIAPGAQVVENELHNGEESTPSDRIQGIQLFVSKVV